MMGGKSSLELWLPDTEGFYVNVKPVILSIFRPVILSTISASFSMGIFSSTGAKTVEFYWKALKKYVTYNFVIIVLTSKCCKQQSNPKGLLSPNIQHLQQFSLVIEIFIIFYLLVR